MEAALDCCGRLENTRQERELYERCFRQITQTMFSAMGSARAGNNINADFMREMIPHHKGAIRMSRNALRFPVCPELKPILEAIIRSSRRACGRWRRCCAACEKRRPRRPGEGRNEFLLGSQRISSPLLPEQQEQAACSKARIFLAIQIFNKENGMYRYLEFLSYLVDIGTAALYNIIV